MLQKPIKKHHLPKLAQGLLLLACLAFSFNVFAIEFRSIAPVKAILYDAPSVEASKLYILNQGYPVEIIVNLGAWVKIRDQKGGLSWVDSKQLSVKRTVLVLNKIDIKSAEDAASAIVATVEKDVVLELLPTTSNTGWLKVKHRDGVTGYIQASNLWGVN